MNPQQQLDKIASDGLLRSLTIRDKKTIWNFSSNDYLGLSQHPEIIQTLIEGVRKYGAGATASRLVTGTKIPHLELEEAIAKAKQTEAALTFSSGYTAAQSAIPVIIGKGDFVILDKLSHACLIDAARASKATLRIFPHNRVAKLDQLLADIRSKHKNARILVITESVFSMDGDLCPLLELLETSEKYSAEVLLDEAHAMGVIGENGLGLAELLGVQDRVHFHLGTMSKALGLSGGYLAASRPWVDLLINRARPFIYTTATPPALACAALKSLEIIQSAEGKKLRSALSQNIQLLKKNHPSAILPIIIGENEAALEASKKLAHAGFLCPAIRYPTVPRNTARLRITISANHSADVVSELGKALNILSA